MWETLINKSMKNMAPKAKKVYKELEKFGDIRVDNYYWLNDRENQEVIDYLNAENDFLKLNSFCLIKAIIQLYIPH